MLYEADIYQMQVEDHIFWVAESNVLKGCVGQGETSAEAISELEANEQEWLKTADEFSIPIPPRTIKKSKSYNGKISLRVSPYIHERAAHNAAFLKISLNQYITDSLSEYNERVASSFLSIAGADSQKQTASDLIDFPHSIKNKPKEM